MKCIECGNDILDLADPCPVCGEMNYVLNKVGTLEIKNRNGKYGLIDSDTHSVMLDPIFDKIVPSSLDRNLYDAIRESSCYFIGKHYLSGVVILYDSSTEPKYILRNGLIVNSPVHFSNGYSSFLVNGLYGIISDKYDIIFPPTFTSASATTGIMDYAIDFTYRAENKKEDVIFIKTLERINERIHELRDYFESYPKYYWYYDSSLRKIVALDFSSDDKLVFGVRRYFENGMWGLISQSGEIVQKPLFSDIETFSDLCYAVAKRDNMKGIIDKAGRTIVEFKYDTINEFGSGQYLAWCNEEQYSVLISTGNKVKVKRI